MLEESRTSLFPFMVRRFYEQRGSFEALQPSSFFLADVMKSIDGRRDPSLAGGVLDRICTYGSIVTVPNNISITYSVHNV